MELALGEGLYYRDAFINGDGDFIGGILEGMDDQQLMGFSLSKEGLPALWVTPALAVCPKVRETPSLMTGAHF